MMQSTNKCNEIDKITEAKHVFDTEIEALEITKDSIDNTFVLILNLISTCTGKVVVTGMGKSGHIGSKIAATLSSLGTSSFFLHPGEAMHGDLGMISASDIVIAISYSGESEEIIRIIPNIKMIGATLIGITGNKNSSLAQMSDIVQVFPKFNEAGNLKLAPTSSTTVSLCYGDALAVVASEVYGFENSDFGKFHPAGSLGKKIILKVNDLMASSENNAVININSSLKDAIVELSKKGLGIVSVIDNNMQLLGVITDGDLRRQLENEVDIYALQVKDIMTTSPTTIENGKLAVDALNILKKRNISAMPVVEKNKVVGTIRLQDIIGIGIVG